MSSPIKISEEAKQAVRAFLRSKLSGGKNGTTLFRRFDYVRDSDGNPIIYKILSPEERIKIDVSEHNIYDEEYRRKHIEINYKSFTGLTSGKQIRDENRNLQNIQLYLKSSNYHDFNLSENNLFELKRAAHKTPLQNDLIFAYFKNETLEKWKKRPINFLRPVPDAWCIVSEQFLKAWTVIMYDTHESIYRVLPSDTTDENFEERLRHKLFKGNFLMTNSFLKLFLTKVDNDKTGMVNPTYKTIMTKEEYNRFVCMRTEYISRKYVDCWACVVLIARYGELPCTANKMLWYSLNSEQRAGWSLPRNFVSSILKSSVKNLEENLENYDSWKNAIKDNSSEVFVNIDKISRLKGDASLAFSVSYDKEAVPILEQWGDIESSD